MEPSLGVAHRGDKWILGGRVSTTFATDDYMDGYFSVGAANPSGLAAFSAAFTAFALAFAFASREVIASLLAIGPLSQFKQG